MKYQSKFCTTNAILKLFWGLLLYLSTVKDLVQRNVKLSFFYKISEKDHVSWKGM